VYAGECTSIRLLEFLEIVSTYGHHESGMNEASTVVSAQAKAGVKCWNALDSASASHTINVRK
jgi:hypothetical protein